MVNSIGLGKAVDGFVGNSEVAQNLAGPWRNGESDFTADLSRLLGSVDTADLKNLTVSALLIKLIKGGSPESDKLQRLLDTARELGVADHSVAALAALDGAKR